MAEYCGMSLSMPEFEENVLTMPRFSICLVLGIGKGFEYASGITYAKCSEYTALWL